MKKEELIKFIKDELSYDGGSKWNMYIDHKSSLAGNIRHFLGLPNKSWEKDKIYEIIDELSPIFGDKKIDSEHLGEIIWEAYQNQEKECWYCNGVGKINLLL